MWHKAIWKRHPMRLELTRVGLLVELANHYTTRGASVQEWCNIHMTRWRPVFVYKRNRLNSCPSSLHWPPQQNKTKNAFIYPFSLSWLKSWVDDWKHPWKVPCWINMESSSLLLTTTTTTGNQHLSTEIKQKRASSLLRWVTQPNIKHCKQPEVCILD